MIETAGTLEKRYVNAAGHRLCYVEGGDPSAPPALLLHGWIASHQLYRRVWPALAERFHFRALDLPGFGDSDKPDPRTAAYDVGFFADVTQAFLEATGWAGRRIIVVAQSMGGMVGTELAARHPERVEKLILIDSGGVEVPPPLLGRLLQAPLIGRPLFMALGGTRKALRDFLVKDVYHVTDVFDPAVLDDMVRAQRQPGGRAAAHAAMMRMLAPAAVRAFTPRFDALQVPTRLIWGANDRLFPLATCGRVIERRVPGARLFVVEDCGHEPPVERPAGFIAALTEALAS